MEVSFTVPNLGEISTRSWLVIATIIGAAILSSIVVELYKRHYFKKKDVKLAKGWIAIWLSASSVFFTYLGYALLLASANVGMIKGLPFVGNHALEVLGIGYLIYNLSLNKWYQAVATWLGKWSKSDDKVVTPLSPDATAKVNYPGDEREFSLPE